MGFDGGIERVWRGMFTHWMDSILNVFVHVSHRYIHNDSCENVCIVVKMISGDLAGEGSCSSFFVFHSKNSGQTTFVADASSFTCRFDVKTQQLCGATALENATYSCP